MSLGRKIHTSLLHSLVTKACIHNTECQYCAYGVSDPGYVVYTIYGSR